MYPADSPDIYTITCHEHTYREPLSLLSGRCRMFSCTLHVRADSITFMCTYSVRIHALMGWINQTRKTVLYKHDIVYRYLTFPTTPCVIQSMCTSNPSPSYQQCPTQYPSHTLLVPNLHVHTESQLCIHFQAEHKPTCV